MKNKTKLKRPVRSLTITAPTPQKVSTTRNLRQERLALAARGGRFRCPAHVWHALSNLHPP